MDGTIVDTEPYWIAAEFEVVDLHGDSWSEEHAKAVVGFDLLDSGEYMRAHGGVRLSAPEIVELLLDRVVARLRENVPWRPGARELLTAVRDAEIPSALVTMSWRRFADEVVACLPEKVFSATVVGDEVAEGKPHPEPYLLAAEKLGVNPRDCLAIEDSPTGARSALAAGCWVLGVPNVVQIPEYLGDEFPVGDMNARDTAERDMAERDVADRDMGARDTPVSRLRLIETLENLTLGDLRIW